MSELNLDAERAAFEAWLASKGDADIAWLERDKRYELKRATSHLAKVKAMKEPNSMETA